MKPIHITGLCLVLVLLMYVKIWTREPCDVAQQEYQTISDPLITSSTGFPPHPLTIDSAHLCDERKNIILSRSWTCPNDTTCRKCRVREIKRFETLQKALTVSLSKSTIPMASDVVVVMAVNKGQVDFLLNWACSLEVHGIGTHKDFAFVVPTDMASYTRLKEFDFNMVEPSWINRLDRSIGTSYHPLKANVGGHSDINNVLFLATNYVLQNSKNQDVLLHDVDQVWLNDGPIKYLKQAANRRDILGMESPYDAAQGGINTGFVYFSNTKKSRVFLQSVINVAGLKAQSDQVLFNTMLRHRRFLTLQVQHLPPDVISKYSGSRHTKVTDKALVFHAVSIKKREHFEKYGLWYLDDTATYKCVQYNLTKS